MKHGGKRKGSGRKPVTDKKQPVTVYIRQSTITLHGGKDKVRDKLKRALA